MSTNADGETRRTKGSRKAFSILSDQIRGLLAEDVDYDDPAAEAAHYARATPVIEAAIATRARRLADLEVKALAVIWCAGGTDFGLGHTLGEQVITSILEDLTARERRSHRSV